MGILKLLRVSYQLVLEIQKQSTRIEQRVYPVILAVTKTTLVWTSQVGLPKIMIMCVYILLTDCKVTFRPWRIMPA